MIAQGEKQVQCPALSAVTLPPLSLAQSVENAKYDRFFVYELYDEAGTLLSKQTLLFLKPKHFEWKKPNILTDVRQDQDEMRIMLASDVFAKGVCVRFKNTDVVLSDNFVDLTDDQPVWLTVEKWLGGNAKSISEMEAGIEVYSIAEIGE